MENLNLKILLEVTEVIKDAKVDVMYQVFDERVEFCFKTIAFSCPVLKELDIEIKPFRTPYMKAKERRSSLTYRCPFPHAIGVGALKTLEKLTLTNFRVRLEEMSNLSSKNLESLVLINCGDEAETATVKEYFSSTTEGRCVTSIIKKNISDY